METSMRLFFLLLLVGCSDKADEGGDPEPQINGTIGIEGEAESGEVSIYKGFGVDAGGTMLAYLSSNPDSTCEMVFDYLAADNGAYDPSELILGGTCDLYFHMSGYESPLAAKDDPIVGAGLVINCAMGEGKWELQTRDDTDFYWTGRWWQGHPTAYELGLSGGDEESYVFDLEMSAWDGNFIYEDLSQYSGGGEVTGSLEMEWCSDLATTSLF